MVDDSKPESTVDILLGELEVEVDVGTASSPPPPPPSIRPKNSSVPPPPGRSPRSVPPPPPKRSGGTDVIDVAELEELSEVEEFEVVEAMEIAPTPRPHVDEAAAPVNAPMIRDERLPAPHAPVYQASQSDLIADVSSGEFVEIGPDELVEHVDFSEEMIDAAHDLIAECESKISSETDNRQGALLHQQIGRLYEMPLADLPNAIRHFQVALDKDPSNIAVIQDARRALLNKKRYPAALELYDPEIRLSADPREKATLLLEKGLLMQDVLGKPNEARAVLRNAQDLDRANPTILQVLSAHFSSASAARELDLCLEHSANGVAADAAHRAAIVSKRAEIVERDLGQRERAIELYETAIRLSVRAPGALSALKRLHHQSGRWRDLGRVLTLEADESSDAQHEAQLRYRIARIQRQRLGNDAEALAALERAAELAPTDIGVLTELGAIHERSGRWEALSDVLQRLTQVEKSPRALISLLNRLGTLHQGRLDDSAGAVHWFNAALAIDPLHPPTIRSLEALYEKEGAGDEIIRIRLAEALHSPVASTRAAAYSRVGELHATANRIDDAITAHGRALAADPSDATPFKSLVRLLTKSGRHRDLVDLRERAIADSHDGVEKTAHLFEIGALFEGPLGEPSRAADTYGRILKYAATDLRALGAMQRACENAERYGELLDAIDLEISATNSAARKRSLQQRAGEILEHHLGDTTGAIARYRKVLEGDPKHLPALASLARLYDAAGRWEDLVETLAKELVLKPDVAAQISLHQKLGDLSRHQLGRESDALNHYRAAFELDRTNRPAASALLAGLEQRRDYAAMAKVLGEQASATQAREERARLHYQVGALFEEHLNDNSKALVAYEKALESQPAHRPSFDALIRLRHSAQNFNALAKGLAAEAALSDDSSGAIEALLQEGSVWAHRLGDPRKATAAYERVLEIQATHLGALLALEHLHRVTSRWSALAAVHAMQARVFVDGGARIAALHAEARVRSAHSVGTSDDLRDVYRAILNLDPEDALALRAIGRLALMENAPGHIAEAEALAAQQAQSVASKVAHLVRLGEVEETMGRDSALTSYQSALAMDQSNLAATRGLSRLAEQRDDPDVLVAAATQEATVAGSGEEAATHLVRAARIRVERLANVDEAIDDLERALELHPGSREAARDLSAILRRRSDFSRLKTKLSAAASKADAERSAELWLESAGLLSDDMDDRHGAISVLDRLLRTMPNHVPTLQRQAGYFHDEGQFSEAIALYGRIVRLAPDSRTLRNTHLELARLWDDKLGDSQRSLVSLQAVLSIDPTNLRGLTRLADIHEREGRTIEASEASKRLLLACPAADQDRAAALVRLARLQREQGLDAAASEALREAVAIEGPGSESALECKALTKSTAAWSQYYDALERHLALLPEDAVKAPTFLEMGRTLFDQLEQRSRAIELLTDGVRETGDGTLARELALRLRSTGEHERSVEVLIDLATGNPERPELWRELATTYDEAGDPLGARIATQPLAVLGQLSERDEERLRAAPVRPRGTKAGSLSEELLDRLGSPTPAQSAASDLLRVLQPALTKLYPPDFESYDLSSRDKLAGGRNPHPFRTLAEHVAGIFGVEAFDVYVHEVRSRGLAIELASPPAIIMPAPVLELPESQQVFLLARSLAHIARGFPATEKLTPRELEVLLASAARNVQERYGTGLTNEDILDEQAKRIYKALPRRSRKAMEEAARIYVDAGRVDFARWVRGAERTATRAASLVSDDLNGSVEVLRRTERDLSVSEGEELVRSSDVVRDLVVFWASKAGMHLRRHMGIIK